MQKFIISLILEHKDASFFDILMEKGVSCFLITFRKRKWFQGILSSLKTYFLSKIINLLTASHKDSNDARNFFPDQDSLFDLDSLSITNSFPSQDEPTLTNKNDPLNDM